MNENNQQQHTSTPTEPKKTAQQQEPVTERLMDCDDCGGTGVDGDVDDRGGTIDVQCRSCAGSGKTAQQEHVEHTSVRRSGPHM